MSCRQPVERCGDTLPLALAIVSAVAAGAAESPEDGQRFDNSPPFTPERYRWIERQLRDIDAADNDNGNDQQHPPAPAAAVNRAAPYGVGGYNDGGTLRKVIKLGFDALREEKTKDCFVMLGVLPQGAVTGEDMLGNLWGQVRPTPEGPSVLLCTCGLGTSIFLAWEFFWVSFVRWAGNRYTNPSRSCARPSSKPAIQSV